MTRSRITAPPTDPPTITVVLSLSSLVTEEGEVVSSGDVVDVGVVLCSLVTIVGHLR